jgi:hypothetical protein
LDVFDALFDDEAPERRTAAHQVAVRLCASCPAPCPEQVTAGSGPRSSSAVVLDDAEVTGREERPARKQSRIAAWCAANPVPWQSEAYVPPARRAEAHAREAAHLASLGLTVAQVADRLCVTVETAAALLRLAETVHQYRTAA